MISAARAALVTLALIAAPAASFAADVPAFPGAEGFGARATGGRGKPVYEVTNLNDSGPGSLRDAVSEGNRTIIFRVSGTIELEKRLTVSKPNITLAGQTAPGDGICLRGKELFIVDTDNVIVRFLRLRPGDERKEEHDALSIRNSGNVIIDHCSLSWSTDSLNDVTHASGNVTVQWCILSEPLDNSVHVKGAHGYGTGWDGRIKGGGSFHHNLIAHCHSRAPRIGYYKEGRGLIDCRNNVIYNSGPSYGGETDDFNFVANYYRPGPQDLRRKGELFAIWSDDARMHVAGNLYEGEPAVAADNAVAVTFNAGRTAGGEAKRGDAATCLLGKPFDCPAVITDPAEQAYRRVLEHAGATLPRRDAVDARVLADVRNRTGRVINSQSAVGGWPKLNSAPPPRDADRDGMPDDWERARGLDPSNSQDGPTLTADGYTNLEHYLNHLATPPGR